MHYSVGTGPIQILNSMGLYTLSNKKKDILKSVQPLSYYYCMLKNIHKSISKVIVHSSDTKVNSEIVTL